MAETLGSLCDKLTIVKLKQWHTTDDLKQKSLSVQQQQLENEINQFVNDAISGVIPLQKITFAANKVYASEGNDVPKIIGSVGQIVSQLATINCELWHEQEKVYEFEKVPIEQKDVVVKQLARLNLERTRCIDEIDKNLLNTLIARKAKYDGERKCI